MQYYVEENFYKTLKKERNVDIELFKFFDLLKSVG